MREKLSSRLGFLLLSAGCAVGIGNVWRFPYITGKSGGGWFVLVYLFFLAVLGIPVLVMELACGRASNSSIVRAYKELTPERPAWRWHGIVGLVGNVCLMMFYTTVSGWMLTYFCKTATGGFAGMSPADVGAAFGAVVNDPSLQAVAMLAVCLTASAVCSFGLQRGIEPVVKWMMMSLFLLIVALAVNSIALDGAAAGLKFFLLPSAGRVREIGFGAVVVNAASQAFFTLSLGIGAMAIFGSYIDRGRRLLGEAVTITVLDTVVAVAAGLIVIPACFAFGVEPAQGPGLIFVTLPNVFNHMAGGRIWGSLFFLFMCFAALTTVFTVYENIVACIRDLTGWSRRSTCILLAVAMPLLSMPCILGFGMLSWFQPFGAGSNVLDLEDFVLSDMILPLSSVAYVIYCSHRIGWGWRGFVGEANEGIGIRFSPGLRAYCAYALPLLVLTIFVVGMYNRFFAR